MMEKDVSFYSDGYKLDATLYYPDDFQPDKTYPAIIPNSGYNGFKQFYPKLFAEQFTKHGFICLGFDYRGFGKSEGQKGRVILDEQVEDIRNAISFLSVQEGVDPDKLAILGWGMGASNVVRVAAADRRVKAVAALNGFYNGERWLSTVHDYVAWRNILDAIEEDRRHRVLTGKSKEIGAFDHYPLDPTTEHHVNVELVHIEGFGHPVNVQFTESVKEMNAEAVVKNIAPRPILIAHGKRNLLHPIEEAFALYRAAGEPKVFHEIDGAHNDFMYRDHPEFARLIDALVRFFNAHLGQAK